MRVLGLGGSRGAGFRIEGFWGFSVSVALLFLLRCLAELLGKEVTVYGQLIPQCPDENKAPCLDRTGYDSLRKL